MQTLAPDEFSRLMPESGLFGGGDQLFSPDGFPLDPQVIRDLEKLGRILLKFQTTCNNIYFRSLEGRLPTWIAGWLDQGKPPDILEISRRKSTKNSIPRVIRPDLILTDQGWILTEIDSLPGGLGMTAYLQKIYGTNGHPVIGGEDGISQAFKKLLPDGDVLIAEEGLDYMPEWEYLAGKKSVSRAENYTFSDKPTYRFFEAFDWGGLHSFKQSFTEQTVMTPPLKPFLEEKLWLALFWMRPLRELWRQELGEGFYNELTKIIPESWPVCPDPIPPHAVLPGLDVPSWNDVAAFSQKSRQLILKISGFSPLGWGSRGVCYGADVSSQKWAQEITAALDRFPQNPSIMQRYHKGKSFIQPYFSGHGKQTKNMRARVRLCPYYFVSEDQKSVDLCGILATLCPDDKKIIHGMRDAIITIGVKNST